jgi:hypothetical protein
VPADELPEPVPAAGPRRRHGLVPQEAAEVLGEGAGGAVAALAVALERLEQHRVEVAGEGVAQRRALGAARPGAGGALHVGEGAVAGARRGHVAGGLARHEGPPGRVVERAHAGEQLVEHHAQRVHVGARVDVGGGARELLGAHVGGRAHRRAGDRGRRRVGPRRHRLGDPEVDDLAVRLPVDLGHEHVRRLEVAVDDALLVRVLHRAAHLAEERHALAHRERPRVGVLGDGRARHALHHEVRQPGVGHARVVHARDVRVLHEGQRLALGRETRHHLVGGRGRAQHLERHVAAHRRVLLGEVDGAHAALAEKPDHAVGADALRPRRVPAYPSARGAGRRRGRRRRERRAGRRRGRSRARGRRGRRVRGRRGGIVQANVVGHRGSWAGVVLRAQETACRVVTPGT